MTKTEAYWRAKGRDPIERKECLICHTGFDIFMPSQRTRTKYCSSSCSAKARGQSRTSRAGTGLVTSGRKGNKYKVREQITCEKCCKPFEIIPSNKAQKGRRFCSAECSYGMNRGSFVGENSPLWSEHITSSCLVCRTDFTHPINRKQKVCSKECADKSFRRRIVLVCQCCGLPYETRAKRAKVQKYCSRRCRALASPIQDTKIERKIEALLDGVPNLIKQYPLDRLFVDFAIPSAKLFIECDGDYWHSLPAAKHKDAIKDCLAEKQGWKMLRLTETEINKDIDGCRIKLETALGYKLQQPPSAQ